MNRRALTIALLIALGVECGNDGGSSPGDVGDAWSVDGDAQGQVDPHRDERGAWVVGHSVEGRPIVAEQFGTEGPVLFVFAAIHGDERSAVTCGEQIRVALIGGLAERAGVRIIFIGAANPDGIALEKRGNSRGVDVNRNFPATNFGDGDGSGGTDPESEPETQAIMGVLSQIEPDAVLSIHCCVPALDYDGPAQGLASTMHRAMLADARFPVLRLGSYPGSAGSLIGVDWEVPIVTVEFAVDEMVETRTQIASVELAVEAAADWVAPRESDNSALYLEGRHSAGASVEPFVLTESAGGLPVRADMLLGSDDPPVLLIAGLADTHRFSLNVAEHVRRVLLSSFRGLPAVIVTVVNPDGVQSGSASNSDGLNVASDLFNGQLETPEAEGLDALINSQQPRLVVVLELDDRSSNVSRSELAADWVVDSIPEGLEDLGIGSGPLFTHFDRLQIPLVRIGVHGWYGRGDDRSGDQAMPADPEVFSTFTRRIIKLGVMCVYDFFCDPFCASDPDCSCDCDYNPVCEAADRDSTDACPCDPDCEGGGTACSHDAHCDTWCPENTDPDCACGCDYYPVCEVAERGSAEVCTCDPDCEVGEEPCGEDGHCDTWCPEGSDPDC